MRSLPLYQGRTPPTPRSGPRSTGCAPRYPGLSDRRRRGGEPRPAGGALSQDAAGHRSRAGPRIHPAAGRAPGTADRCRRSAHQPAGHRRRVRGGEVDLPGRGASLAARLPVPGLPRRVGSGVLLRDDLRDLDGLHGVPALERQGALGPQPRSSDRDGRRHGPFRPGDLRRRRR